MPKADKNKCHIKNGKTTLHKLNKNEKKRDSENRKKKNKNETDASTV